MLTGMKSKRRLGRQNEKKADRDDSVIVEKPSESGADAEASTATENNQQSDTLFVDLRSNAHRSSGAPNANIQLWTKIMGDRSKKIDKRPGFNPPKLPPPWKKIYKIKKKLLIVTKPAGSPGAAPKGVKGVERTMETSPDEIKAMKVSLGIAEKPKKETAEEKIAKLVKKQEKKQLQVITSDTINTHKLKSQLSSAPKSDLKKQVDGTKYQSHARLDLQRSKRISGAEEEIQAETLFESRQYCTI